MKYTGKNCAIWDFNDHPKVPRGPKGTASSVPGAITAWLFLSQDRCCPGVWSSAICHVTKYLHGELFVVDYRKQIADIPSHSTCLFTPWLTRVATEFGLLLHTFHSSSPTPLRSRSPPRSESLSLGIGVFSKIGIRPRLVTKAGESPQLIHWRIWYENFTQIPVSIGKATTWISSRPGYAQYFILLLNGAPRNKSGYPLARQRPPQSSPASQMLWKSWKQTISACLEARFDGKCPEIWW